MNKYLAFCFALFVLVSCKKTNSEAEQFKVDFYTGCMQSIKNSAVNLYNFELSKDYCNCVTATVLPQLSEDEIQQVSSVNNEQIQNKINQLVEPCLQDYLNKSKSLE